MYLNDKRVNFNIAKLNAELKAAGLEGLPERVVVTKNPLPFWKVLSRRLEALEKFKGKDVWFAINRGYLHEYPAICYRGAASDVVGIIDAMNDNFLHTDQGLLAFRQGNTLDVRDERFESRKAFDEAYEHEDYSAEKKAFFGYDKKSDAVLVMSDLGPHLRKHGGQHRALHAFYSSL